MNNIMHSSTCLSNLRWISINICIGNLVFPCKSPPTLLSRKLGVKQEKEKGNLSTVWGTAVCLISPLILMPSFLFHKFLHPLLYKSSEVNLQLCSCVHIAHNVVAPQHTQRICRGNWNRGFLRNNLLESLQRHHYPVFGTKQQWRKSHSGRSCTSPWLPKVFIESL